VIEKIGAIGPDVVSVDVRDRAGYFEAVVTVALRGSTVTGVAARTAEWLRSSGFPREAELVAPGAQSGR
jgi:hypothetical protein